MTLYLSVSVNERDPCILLILFELARPPDFIGLGDYWIYLIGLCSFFGWFVTMVDSLGLFRMVEGL